MNLMRLLRKFLRYSYKRDCDRKRTFLVLRTWAMIDRDNFEGYMRCAGQKRGAMNS